jgi:hypothetical protein
MRYHYADGIHPVECPAQHGRRCRICELTDPAHPDHNPAYLALYTDEPTGGPGFPLAGDIIAAATARLGIDRLAKYVAEQLGGECHCPERQEKLNRLDARLRRWLGIG